jgi:hypothetical protein
MSADFHLLQNNLNSSSCYKDMKSFDSVINDRGDDQLSAVNDNKESIRNLNYLLKFEAKFDKL